MTRKWNTRLPALGVLALALGCRSHPACPPCQTPLFPEDVINQPDRPPPAPPTTGAQLPATPGTILPPPQFSKLPESKQPSVHLPDSSPDLPPIVPPPDVAQRAAGPAMTGPRPREVSPLESAPAVKPLLVDPPKPPAGPDGFAPAPKIGLPDLPAPAVGVRPPAGDTRPPVPLRPGERFGHAADYKWVAGILDRHVKGGYWTVRYAPSGEDDPWGGKVRLLDEDKLAGFASGDVVYVEGELLAPRSAADMATYPPFRVTDVRLIEKAK